MQRHTHNQRARRAAAIPSGAGIRGFSLIEMLVVLAVASILLGLVIMPLISTFNITNQARRGVEVQDAARYASELVSREVADSMGVAVSGGDALPFNYYTSGTPGRGDAVVARSAGFITAYDDAGSAWELRHALMDIVLPHDALGLAGGGIQQPLVPQYQRVDSTQHPVIVRYFVGLTHPSGATFPPRWHNRAVTGTSRAQNLYTLYRVEFDPYDPRYANWIEPTASGKDPEGRPIHRINPDFFYDNTEVSYGGQTRSYAQWWRRKAVAIMPTDNMDLVDFVRGPGQPSGPYQGARSLVTFDPLVVPADAAAAGSSEQRPSTYKTQYGHWTGIQNDGTIPADRYSGGLAGFLPRIQVLQQLRDSEGQVTLTIQFDSSLTDTGNDAHPANQNRVLAWNSLKGTVEFSLPAPDYESNGGGDGGPSIYEPLRPHEGWTAPPGAYITPASEVVTVWEADPNAPNNASLRRPVVYSRAASDVKDVYEVPEEIAIQNGMPQQLPPPRQYIVTDGGRILIGYPYPSVGNPVQSQPVPNGHRVRISFFYQNNGADDLVKVDYLTRELITINMTARSYDPVTRKPITTTLANRVRIRNMQR